MAYRCSAFLGGLIALQCATAESSGDVAITTDGFAKVRSSKNDTQMQAFIARAVSLFGGRVHDDAGLQKSSKTFARSDKQFKDMLSEVMLHPRWAAWDEHAACVANRQASAVVLGKGIEYACSNMKYFDCQNVPVACSATEASAWVEADYIFSVYFNERGGAPYPTCHMAGAAIFQPSAAYLPPAVGAKSGCVVTRNPVTTPITDEGYHAVIGLPRSSSHWENSTVTESFILRIAASRLSGEIKNDVLLREWSRNPPQDFQSLLKWLPALLKPPQASGALCNKFSLAIVFGAFGLIQEARHTQ